MFDKFAKSGESTVHIGLVLPDVLGTYGDNGNAQVLLRRLRWRGFPAAIVPITIDVAVPESLDVYLLGGGEDSAQSLATDRLTGQPGLRRAVDRGAPVLAVCAGLQVIGREFTLEDRIVHKGLGLLDLATTPAARRAVGEIVTMPATGALTQPLTGFENHRGHSTFGRKVRPLGRTVLGIGNGDGTDGVLQDNIIGTYLHGPVLARNPELADLLLAQAIGTSLAPIDLAEVHHLRSERLGTAPRQVRQRLAPEGKRSAGGTRLIPPVAASAHGQVARPPAPTCTTPPHRGRAVGVQDRFGPGDGASVSGTCGRIVALWPCLRCKASSSLRSA